MFKRSLLAAFALSSLAACSPRTPTTESVATPEWTSRFEMSVRKRGCDVTDKSTGKSYSVSRNGTPMTDGFVADRWKRRCSIEAADGTRCVYNTAERIQRCTRPIAPSSKSQW